MAQIPLNCSICPKKPSFSDISHLLTHVGSKGHLSHYHKLQVKSHQEPQARYDLAIYDQWYAVYGVPQLLSERMLSKESKKANGQTRPRKSNQGPKAQRKPTNTVQTNNVINSHPMQSNVQEKCVTSSVLSTSNIGPFWHAGPSQAFNADEPFHVDDNSELDSSPIVRKTRAAVQPFSGIRLPDPFVDDEPGLSTDDLADCPAEDDPDVVDNDSSKLKGILWPGMDLFDAATEHMRKTRNQKKDGSMLHQMEMSSESVEATEVIFSPGGTMRKQRPIGMIEDSSPLKGETPIPKKRTVRPKRKALADRSTNLPQTKRRGRKMERDTHENPYRALEELSFEALPYVSNSPEHGQYSRYSPTADENLEFQLTVGNLAKKRGGGLAVFTDNDEAPMPSKPDPPRTASRPRQNAAPVSFGAAASGTVPGPASAPQLSGLQHYLPQISAGYPVKGSAGFGISAMPVMGLGIGKETGHQPLRRAERINAYDLQTRWTPSDAIADVYRQYNRSIQLQMNFGQSPSYDSYGFNPLAAGFNNFRQLYDGSHGSNADPFTSYGPFDENKLATSPNHTVSDLGNNDLAHDLFRNPEH